MTDITLNPDKVLIFDIKGQIAHFRKYYTNSSSLTYTFPPRTVIIGLIAGILGLPNEHSENDGNIYYEIFNDKNCKITVSLRRNVRKVMQTVNYTFTKTTGKKIDFSKPSQIPLELIFSEDNFKEIVYRIYFYYRDDMDNKFYHELKKRLEDQRFIYPPYLGLTEFLASINYIGEGKLTEIDKNEIEINSICKLADVEPVFENNDAQYLIEKMPTGFSNERIPKRTQDYIFEMKNKLMKINLKEQSSGYHVNYSENECKIVENIMFM